MNPRRLLLLAGCVISMMTVYSQNPLWTAVDPSSVGSYTNTRKNLLPESFHLAKLNRAMAAAIQAVATQQNGKGFSPAIFEIPLPGGEKLVTTIYQTKVLSPELSAQYPDIKTYQLTDPSKKTILGTITVTPGGVNGILFTPKGSAYINPLGSDFPDLHMVYYVKELKILNRVNCSVADELSMTNAVTGLAAPMAGSCQLRTFRLAITTTGEYTNWAGSQANAIAAATVTVNNVSAIYERDLAIRLTIVTNNSVIYPDPATDPYTDPPSLTGTTLAQAQNALTTNLGAGAFDLGMVFHRGWNGGIASVGVVCNAGFKGRGASGCDFGTGSNPVAGPQGPIFDGVVAHEAAHQFNARHSFASNNGGCLGNTNGPTAWEPGGGSTLMAYAGVCTGNSYQNNTDLYFHAGSIAEIQAFATSGSASCAVVTALSNTAPTVTVPSNTYTIPISTPFVLNSTGADANGNTLKYSWEQMDAGFVTSTSPNSSDISGPNFRSFPFTTSSSRTFPRMQDIVAGINPAYEVLTSVSRTMNFRVTVRDEAAGGGCTAEENIAVTTAASAGPFIVTSQSTPTSWVANGSNTSTVTWNVASTNAAPVSAANVDILFSIDGGLTYPYTLVASTPNDGSHVITIPNLPTSIGRVRVQASNNIFFNINSAAITISSACSAEAATFTPGTNVTAPVGNPTLNLTLAPAYGTIVTIAGTLDAGDPASFLAINNNAPGACISFGGNQFKYELHSFTVNVSGSYNFSKSAATPNGTIWNLYFNTFNPGDPCSNLIVSNGTYTNPPGSVTLAAGYNVMLTAGLSYTMAVGTFSNGTPALPAAYTINVTPPAGGNLYTGPANPGASFNYTYVMTDNATGLIKSIDPGADLSNTSTFPTGTYTVYGLSYSNTITPATLNSYVNGQFTNLRNDALYNPATFCSNLSKNSIQVNILTLAPVLLTRLEAYKVNQTVSLKWSTLSEQNSSHFELESAADGVNFNKIIGRVDAKGKSEIPVNYQLTDAAPLAEWNYYRVKQFDTDGKTTISNIVRIYFGKQQSLSIFPNPAKTTVAVEYLSENSGLVQAVILDSKGAKVAQRLLVGIAGTNTLSFNIAHLAPGQYAIQIISGKNVITTKFVKQ